MKQAQMHKLNRRDLLKGAGAALAAPYVLTSSALGSPAGRVSASNRIVMGIIGVGGQGSGHLGGMVGSREVQVAAVCDVDRGHREGAKQHVETRYGQDAREGAFKGCAAYGDFRELVAREDIDAVIIASPDHWHGLISIAALESGKDVYCEKPMVHTIPQGRAVVNAARRHGRVFQTGSQERSGRACFACELVRNGRIGKLHTVRTFLPTDQRQCGPQPPAPILDGFDYDMWLGPAPWAYYTPQRCHVNFRWIRDYSDGELTDRGGHVNDIALWGAEPWLVGPLQIEGTGEFPKDGLWDTAIGYHIEYRYANGLRIITTSDGPRGIRFEGEDGWIFVHIHGANLEAEPKSLLTSTIGPNEIRLHRSPGHHQDWLNAIRTRGPTVAPAAAGHQTASFCHLGNAAIILRRKLTWDLKTEQFIGDDEANRLINPPMREPWRL